MTNYYQICFNISYDLSSKSNVFYHQILPSQLKVSYRQTSIDPAIVHVLFMWLFIFVICGLLLVETNLGKFNKIYFLFCHWRSTCREGLGCHLSVISATFVCISQTRTWLVKVLCCSYVCSMI